MIVFYKSEGLHAVLEIEGQIGIDVPAVWAGKKRAGLFILNKYPKFPA